MRFMSLRGGEQALIFPFDFPRIVVPDDDYLERVQALCKKHNILLICDEVQTVSLRAFTPLARR